MTTTSVTVHSSIYNVGLTHVYLDGRASTSTTGTFWSHGWLEWHVYYPGSTTPDESYYGTKRFSIVVPYTRSGTTVKYRAIDRGGNAGSWDETTITVADISTAHYKQYVDADSGNNSNTGTSSGAAVLTLDQATTNVKANWTTDGTHVIYVKRGTTTKATSTPIWKDGHTANGRIIFMSYGAGSGNATIENGGFDVNPGSGQTSMVFWGVDLDFLDTGFNGISLDYNIGTERTVPYDFIALDCTIIDTGSNAIAAGLSEHDSTGRDANTYSFVAIENCTISGGGILFALYGFDYASLIHLVDNHFGPLWTSNTSHPIRIWNVSDLYMRGGTYDAEAPTGNDIRLVAEEGDGEDSAIRRVTMHNIQVSGEIYSHGNVSATDTYYVRDVEVIGGTRMFRPTHNTGGGEGFDVDQILHRNTAHPDYYELDLGSTGTIGEMFWDHCTFIKNFHSGPQITLGGADTRYTAGGITLDSCLFYWDQSGNWFEQDLIQASSMNNSQLAALIAYSDNNVGASVDGDTVYFRDGSVTLATWQGATVHDDNSAVATSTTLPITSLPSSGWEWDPRLSSTGGYLADKGSDPTYLLDIDGHIRVGGYPGVHDPEATTSPDVPTLGGGGGGGDPAPASTATWSRLSLKLGLR